MCMYYCLNLNQKNCINIHQYDHYYYLQKIKHYHHHLTLLLDNEHYLDIQQLYHHSKTKHLVFNLQDNHQFLLPKFAANHSDQRFLS